VYQSPHVKIAAIVTRRSAQRLEDTAYLQPKPQARKQKTPLLE
jgi:hypothetical protein